MNRIEYWEIQLTILKNAMIESAHAAKSLDDKIKSLRISDPKTALQLEEIGNVMMDEVNSELSKISSS